MREEVGRLILSDMMTFPFPIATSLSCCFVSSLNLLGLGVLGGG